MQELSEGRHASVGPVRLTSVRRNFDPARLRLGLLRNSHLDTSVAATRTHVCSIDGVGQSETAVKTSLRSLNPLAFSILSATLLLALTTDQT